MALSFRKVIDLRVSREHPVEVAATNNEAAFRELNNVIDYDISPNTAPSTSQSVIGYSDPVVSVGTADPAPMVLNGPFVEGLSGHGIVLNAIRTGSNFYLRFYDAGEAVVAEQALSTARTFGVDTSGEVEFAGTAWTNAGGNDDPVKTNRGLLAAGMALEYRDDAADQSVEFYIIDRFNNDSEADPMISIANPPDADVNTSTGLIGISVPHRRHTVQVRTNTDGFGRSGTAGEAVGGSINLIIVSRLDIQYLTGLR